MRDGQRFRVKKTKTGVRLVPVFDGPMPWKTAGGYAAMLLILSCLGVEGEYVLWDTDANTDMTVETWQKRRYGLKSKVAVWHRECKETCINNLQTVHSIGCKCNSTTANHWRHRYAEVVAWGKERGFEVVTKETEWVRECTGAFYRPTAQCLSAEVLVSIMR